MNEQFTVSLDTLLRNNLSFEAYFILWCLYNKQEGTITDYVENCGAISKTVWTKLQDKGYLSFTGEVEQITYNRLSISDKGISLFTLKDFDTIFAELREAYPSHVKDGSTRRPLHTDLKRCKALYKKLIETDIEKHKLICKCALLYYNEKKRAGGEKYMQNLATWLHQQNYESYLDEAKNLSDIIGEDNNTNCEVI
jgi:hypothetical protein